MEKIELAIDGMHCTGCSSRLQKVLNSIDEVKATVDFETRKAIIQFNKDSVKLEDIYSAIEEAGFEVKE